jgi:hypothetical protein
MKRNIVLSALALLTVLLIATAPANAQATRTWVSGVGDDANPCSRTAPCKTFAGAISKTAPAGEINVLDPGGFGAVTITKSITISSEYTEAGVLVSGTHAIIISAGPSDVVIIRGLDIQGLGTGLTGIRVLSAGVVHVENCTIDHFTQIGIDFVPSAVSASTSQLHVSNTIVRDNNGASSGGIHCKPGANVTVNGSIENTQVLNNQFGVRVEDACTIATKNTTAAGNAGAGFIAVAAAGGQAVLNNDQCVAVSNLFGIKADNATAFNRFGNCLIAGNGTGIGASGGHTVTFTGSNDNADAGTATDQITRQ